MVGAEIVERWDSDAFPSREIAHKIYLDVKKNLNWANDVPQWSGKNPYGDGNAAQNIISSITVKWI